MILINAGISVSFVSGEGSTFFVTKSEVLQT
jgi:hypothetical protein